MRLVSSRASRLLCAENECCAREVPLKALRLRQFQRQDVNRIKQHELRVILASSQGTGKTPIAVRAVLETGAWSLPALVVAPASVTRHWMREFRRWARGLDVCLVEGVRGPLPQAHVYVTSWALLSPRLSDFMGLRLKTVVADEAHLVKNPEALRSQALYQLTRTPKGLLLLTGTPIINRRDELGVLQSLYGKRPPIIRRLLEDVAPDVPPKKRSYLYVRLRDRADAEYTRAVDDFEDWLRKKKEKLLGEGQAEAVVERALSAEAFAKVGYLRRLVGEAKVPAAADWISCAARIGEPVVVFLEHQDVLKRLRKSLRVQRVRHVVIEGKTSPKKRQRYIDDFQRHKHPVIICTKAGMEGITLHSARHLLFVERFFTSAEEEQAEDRIRRIGQTHPTTMWYLHAAGTIDDRIDAIVRSKRRLIRTSLRSATTEETGVGAVASLVKSWSSFVGPDNVVTDLGRRDPLPPLPRPGSTHVIIFDRLRWKPRSAQRWCDMHGYLTTKKVELSDRFKLFVHPVGAFRENEFTTFQVCGDVKMILGKRRKR